MSIFIYCTLSHSTGCRNIRAGKTVTTIDFVIDSGVPDVENLCIICYDYDRILYSIDISDTHDLKGVIFMFCPKCGTQLDDNARFCSGCGHMFESIPAPEETMTDMEAFVPMEEIPANTPPVSPPPMQEMPPMQQPVQPSPQPAAQVKKKSHAALTAVLSILLVCAVAGSALFYFNPGGMFGGDDDDDDSSSKKDSSSVSQSDDDSEDDESSDTDDESSEETTTETTTTTTSSTTEPEDTTTTADTSPTDDTTTTTSDTETETTTTTSDKQGGSTVNEDEDYNEAMKYSTSDRPDFSEFEWCYGQSDLVRRMPAGAQQIKTANRMAGGWKCMFIYSTSKNSDMLAREINNITIDPTADEVNMTIDWYLMEIPDSESVPEDNMDDTTFPVTVNSNGAILGEPQGGTLVISDFWNDGKNDYAVGEYQTDSGLYAYIALYR